MLFSFHCPACKGRLEVDASLSGTQATCPQCGQPVAIPEGRVDAGTTLAGFRLERRLGKGGMGEVYLARQLSVDRQVAVKVLPPGFAADRQAVARFLHEGRLAARLDHANIATVYEAGEDSGHYYLAMAYIEGESLDQRLKRDGALPEAEALAIVRSVADALAHAWETSQLLHRDIKPANIMVDRRQRVFLMDLGLAKSMGEESGMTLSGTILGTPLYMSPEQAQGHADLGVPTDIYSLGATLYHLATGGPPFAGDSALTILNQHVHAPLPPPRERNPRMSKACGRLIERMMAKKPADRHGDWQALLADIDQILAPGASVASGRSLRVGRSAVTPEILAREAQAALARRHRVQAGPSSGADPAASRRRSQIVLGGVLAGVALVVLAVLVASRRHSGSDAAETLAASPSPTAEVPAVGPSAVASPAQQPVAEPVAVAVPAAALPTAAPVPATPPLPLPPPAVRSPWERITLPHTGDWALAFDGKESGVLVPTLTWDGSEPVTVEAVFTPEGGDAALVAGCPTVGGTWLLVRDGMLWARTLRRQEGKAAVLFAKAPFIPGRTYHAAAIWNGKELRLYMNGRLAAAADLASEMEPCPWSITDSETFKVGRTGQAGLKGRVETVRVSRGSLYTEDFDIGGVLPLKPGRDTLCLLDFEEGAGEVAKDKSGNQHDGQIRGAVWRRMWPCPVSEERLREVEDALCKANPQVRDLAIKAGGLPNALAIDLAGCAELVDIGALGGLPIARLSLSNTKVRDLSPLRGTPLRALGINKTRVNDLEPLRGCPLVSLGAWLSPISDMSPLARSPLRFVDLTQTQVADLGPLAGHPLDLLKISLAPVTNLEPLRRNGLRILILGGSVPDLSPLIECSTLEYLVIPPGADLAAAQRLVPQAKVEQIDRHRAFRKLNGLRISLRWREPKKRS